MTIDASAGSPAFDAFLSEPVRVEANGMSVSVLSALARLGMDPWAEANRLAMLPRQLAAAAISTDLALARDLSTAERLADLLPRPTAPGPATGKIGTLVPRLWRDAPLLLALWMAVCVLFELVTKH